MATNKNLTWDELANDYDSCHSIFKARTLPIEDVFRWAKKQDKKYEITEAGAIRYREQGGKRQCQNLI